MVAYMDVKHRDSSRHGSKPRHNNKLCNCINDWMFFFFLSLFFFHSISLCAFFFFFFFNMFGIFSTSFPSLHVPDEQLIRGCGWKSADSYISPLLHRLYNGNPVGQQFGPKCNRGDRIGCGIYADAFDAGLTTVFFTKNGKEVSSEASQTTSVPESLLHKRPQRSV